VQSFAPNSEEAGDYYRIGLADISVLVHSVWSVNL